MEDNYSIQGRTLRRCHACNRLEEQLWTAAYEQIWPIARRSLQRATEQARPIVVGVSALAKVSTSIIAVWARTSIVTAAMRCAPTRV
jgi:hypothetical protein